MSLIVIILICLLLFGGLGGVGYRQGWYTGTNQNTMGGIGLVGIIVLVLLVLFLTGHL